MKAYKIMMQNGTKKEMTYDEVCAALEINPNVQFVKITTRGTIGAYVGKPEEFRHLRRMIEKAGFVASKALKA